MKQIIRNTLILLAITLIAGLALACVHEITADPIEQAQQNAKLEAYAKVYKDAKTFADCPTDLSAYEPADGVTVDEVQEAKDADGNTVGWVMTLTSPKGYGGDVRIVIGVTKDGTLTGMTVIEHSETAGLGAKCDGAEFKDQFAGITADSITYSKTGKSAENEIDAISGATFTTSAIVQAVNVGLDLAYTCLGAGGAK